MVYRKPPRASRSANSAGRPPEWRAPGSPLPAALVLWPMMVSTHATSPQSIERRKPPRRRRVCRPAARTNADTTSSRAWLFVPRFVNLRLPLVSLSTFATARDALSSARDSCAIASGPSSATRRHARTSSDESDQRCTRGTTGTRPRTASCSSPSRNRSHTITDWPPRQDALDQRTHTRHTPIPVGRQHARRRQARIGAARHLVACFLVRDTRRTRAHRDGLTASATPQRRTRPTTRAPPRNRRPPPDARAAQGPHALGRFSTQSTVNRTETSSAVGQFSR